MAFIIPNTFAAGAVIDPTLVNANNTAIAAKFNGQIGGSDLVGSSDPVLLSSLVASRQRIQAKLRFNNPVTGFWCAGSLLDFYPLVQESAVGWTADSITWFCAQVGAGVGQFQVQLGTFNGSGAWVSSYTLVNTITMSNIGGPGNASTTSVVGTPYTIAWTGAPLAMALVCVTSDPTACLDWPLVVTISLQRQIQ